MVVASAMLDATGLNVFELGAWQAMSRVGRLAQPNPFPGEGRPEGRR
jgi:hypothetical protein